MDGCTIETNLDMEFHTFEFRMKRFLCLIISTASLIYSFAQSSELANKKMSYGVSPFITIPLLPNHNSSTPSFGGDIFVSYNLKQDYLQSKLGYSFFSIINKNESSIIRSSNLQFSIGYKRQVRFTNEVNFLLSYAPSYYLNVKEKFAGRFSDSFGFPTKDITNEISPKIVQGVYAGLEFQFKEQGSFELGYLHVLNPSNNTNKLIVPSRLMIVYNFNFAKDGNMHEDVFQTRTTLQKLKSDTLYFINRACPDDFTTSQLDSLLRENYSYSAYRILRDDEVAKVSKQPNVVHFAIIGKHYASPGDPESNGIYLLDSKLNSTEYPYPYHTSNPKNGNGLSSCLGGLSNTAFLIGVFNSRLHHKY
ncbi:MAG: hypothetical protein COA58_05270 [Bacteroidetes bacterium]|nr:MAG: hypothetical protein COA58_05270 [Bacteroidota bacterium]